MPELADGIQAQLAERLGEAQPQPRLAPTRRAVELLGDVHRSAPVIHLSGTNGKTSTARIVESLLRAHGLRTGLFTSPHLLSIVERFAIDGQPVAEERLAEAWADIQYVLSVVDGELLAAGEPPLTYFETLTVLGFAIFAEAPVDVIVLEVGMGGEWDSTNVADGEVAVFTPISLDHTARLGRTVAEIARTKAGIIKPGARVVTAAQEPAALAELRAAAAAAGATLAVAGAEFRLLGSTVAVGGQSISVQGLAGRYEDALLPLYGDHQAENAALAIAAVEAFLGDGSRAIEEEILDAGLAEAASPGRLQRIGSAPPVLLDGAHNPAGAAALAAALPRFFAFEQLAIVLGVVADKDVEEMARRLAPLAARIITTRSGSERSIAPVTLAERIEAALGADAPSVVAADDLGEALSAARHWAGAAEGRAVLVTGSLLLVGEALGIALREGWYGRG